MSSEVIELSEGELKTFQLPPTSKQKRIDKILRQDAFLQALNSSLFNISEACRKIEINRSCYYYWIEHDDTDFVKKLQEVRDQKLDFIEHALMQKIKSGDTISIIFALKCLAKKRGYIEQQELKIHSELKHIDKHHRDQIVEAALKSMLSSKIKCLPNEGTKIIDIEKSVDDHIEKT